MAAILGEPFGCIRCLLKNYKQNRWGLEMAAGVRDVTKVKGMSGAGTAGCSGRAEH
jgi:hypothetical protein